MSGKRRKRHGPEEIVRKLRDADAMLNAGKEVAAILQVTSLDIMGNSLHDSAASAPTRAREQT